VVEFQTRIKNIGTAYIYLFYSTRQQL